MQDAIGRATSTWLEQLVARMLYMYPGLRLQGELPSLVEQCTQAQDALGVPLLDLTLQLLQVWGLPVPAENCSQLSETCQQSSLHVTTQVL